MDPCDVQKDPGAPMGRDPDPGGPAGTYGATRTPTGTEGNLEAGTGSPLWFLETLKCFKVPWSLSHWGAWEEEGGLKGGYHGEFRPALAPPNASIKASSIKQGF